jgi:hypothetical protein
MNEVCSMMSTIWIACPPPPNRLVHFPHCTPELSLASLSKAFFFLNAEGREPYLFNATLMRNGDTNAVLTVDSELVKALFS